LQWGTAAKRLDCKTTEI